MKLIVLDTETSDLDPVDGATILEIAWMEVRLDPVYSQWKIFSAYENYIQYDGPISPKAQASHHIQDSCLKPGRAVLREKAIADLLHVIEPDSFIVAHNAEFDSKFLPEITNPWLCTYRAAKKMWPNAPGHSNQVLRYWLGIIPDLSHAPTVRARAPHQALYDVATTTGLLFKMLENRSPAELYQLINTQVLLKTIEFGKHKGLPFDQIPKDYLQWLRSQPKLDDDLKYTLDSILQS